MKTYVHLLQYLSEFSYNEKYLIQSCRQNKKAQYVY